MLYKQQGRTVLARDEVNEEDDDGDRQLHEGHGQLDHLDAAREARADAAQRYPAPNVMYPSGMQQRVRNLANKVEQGKSGTDATSQRATPTTERRSERKAKGRESRNPRGLQSPILETSTMRLAC